MMNNKKKFAIVILIVIAAVTAILVGVERERSAYADPYSNDATTVSWNDDMDHSERSGGTTKSSFARKCEQNGYTSYMFQDEYDYFSYRGMRNRANSTSSCQTQTSNPRGTYTSLGTCTFKFHSIPSDSAKSIYLSSNCSDDNIVREHQDVKDDPVQMKVTDWPDECVADFKRCYHVERDEKTLLRHMCKHQWETLPEGTTHVSVDCTSDKIKMQQAASQSEADSDRYDRYQQRERREFYALVAAMITVPCVCVYLCLLGVYRYFFQPYLKALKSKDRHHSDPDDEELVGLVASSSPDPVPI